MSKAKREPNQEVLRHLFEYNAENGTFYRRKVIDGQLQNVEVGTKLNTGYISISIESKKYLAHRLAWVYVNGGEIQGDIDHINGDKADNRISNLRVTTRSQNLMNQKLSKNNTSGTKGVTWDKKWNRWCVYIKTNGKVKNYGRFDVYEDAVSKAVEVRKSLHEEFYRE